MLAILVQVGFGQTKVDNSDPVLRVFIIRIISTLAHKYIIKFEVIINVTSLVYQSKLLK